MPLPITGFAHIRLTVRDIAVSRAFYDSVFGFHIAHEAPPADADQATKDRLAFLLGGVVYSFEGGALGLRPAAPHHDLFSENRAGLDHLSFRVAAHSDLVDAAARLDALGIAHEQIVSDVVGYILQFRDPDKIALELHADQRCRR